jgi:steroid delta-isomerase-like uncharacterized protein
MSIEENKAIARRVFQEVLSQGNLATADDLVASDVVIRNPEERRGLETWKRGFGAFRDAFPDARFTPDEILATDDKVVIRWTMRGTHRGEYAGAAPTGKQVTSWGISVYRIANGKVVEAWVGSDDLGLLQQIGAVPSV